MIRSKIKNLPEKRGASRGHRGAARVMGEPNEIIHVTVESCANCSHALDALIHKEKRKILDILPPRNTMMGEYDLDVWE